MCGVFVSRSVFWRWRARIGEKLPLKNSHGIWALYTPARTLFSWQSKLGKRATALVVGRLSSPSFFASTSAFRLYSNVNNCMAKTQRCDRAANTLWRRLNKCSRNGEIGKNKLTPRFPSRFRIHVSNGVLLLIAFRVKSSIDSLFTADI